MCLFFGGGGGGGEGGNSGSPEVAGSRGDRRSDKRLMRAS